MVLKKKLSSWLLPENCENPTILHPLLAYNRGLAMSMNLRLKKFTNRSYFYPSFPTVKGGFSIIPPVLFQTLPLFQYDLPYVPFSQKP